MATEASPLYGAVFICLLTFDNKNATYFMSGFAHARDLTVVKTTMFLSVEAELG